VFDIGFWEMSLIALVALVVLGPERLPGVARTAGLWIGRARRMIADVKADIDREIRNAELKEMESLKKDVEETAKEVSETIKGAADAGSKAAKDLDIAAAIKESAEDIKPSTGSADTEDHAKEQKQ
jgi:sec-independent protein translocase protein TatB